MKLPDFINDDWMPFAMEDPFNGNFVEGRISRHSGDDYGALYIMKINHRDAHQLIYCTPKLKYPFDQNGKWHWSKAKRIERYEKLDGTNIFQYRYKDDEGEEYISYKTRLTPFLRESRFGDFLNIWKDILKNNPNIGKLPWKLKMNISYELWGAQNAHLIKYDSPLTASVLFARNGDKILPPSSLDLQGILSADSRGNVDRDYVWNYEEAQRELENKLKETEDGYLGHEGEVWYLLDELNDWIMFKCKPETIEKIHWSAGGIGKNIIKATIVNAFENWDEPTVENIVELLKEEFDVNTIEKIRYNIVKYLDEAKVYNERKLKVIEIYENEGLDILQDKAGTMRRLSSVFEKKEMREVYSIISSYVIK